MKNRNIMKISFIAVALLMLASCVTLAVIDTDDSDAAAFSAGSINFNSTGTMGNIGTAEIVASSSPYGYTGAIVIPSTVSSGGITYTVTAIGANAFKNCPGLTSITLPAGLTTIDNCAFSGCTGLTSITLPAGLTTIGNTAFSSCTGLTSITLPAGLTTIGNTAFSGCTGLTSITLPAGLTSIGEGAFSDCSGLTSITLPASVTSIGASAFSYCSGLTSITLPAGLTTIGEGAFVNDRLYTAHITDYTAATIAGTALTTYKLASQGNPALTHVKISPKVGNDAITIDTTAYRSVGKYLTITAKPDNVTVANFATDWQINTPYTWSGTAWAPAQLVTWTLDANRTVTTVATAGAAPEYYWAPPSGFVGWSPSLAVGTYAYTATYSQPDVPPVDPVPAPTEPAKKVDMAQILLWSCVGLALICGLAYAVTRHPAAGVIALLSVVALILLYAGYLPWKL